MNSLALALLLVPGLAAQAPSLQAGAPQPTSALASSGVPGGQQESQDVPLLGYERIARGQMDASQDLLVYRFFAYPDTQVEITLRSEQLSHPLVELVTPLGTVLTMERVEDEPLGQNGGVFRASLPKAGSYLLSASGSTAGAESSTVTYELLMKCVSGSCPPVASTHVRNGTGVNRLCYSNEAPPLVGGSWRASVDTSGHEEVIRTFVVLHSRPNANGQEPFMTEAGEVLFDGKLPTLCEFSCELDVEFEICEQLVPNDPQLFGVRFVTQAFIVGRDHIELCNAIDITIGF